MKTNEKLYSILDLVLELNKGEEKICFDLNGHVNSIRVYCMVGKEYESKWAYNSYYNGTLVDFKDNHTVPLDELYSFLKSLLPVTV